MKVQVKTTFGTGRYQEHLSQSVLFTGGETENEVVNLYPEVQGQVFEGFGGAMTEAAASVYAQMSPAEQERLLTTYFTEERMNYRLLRIHMDSCDFCRETYEAMSDPEDTLLKSFSLERDEKWILPMLRDAQRIAGRPLKLMLSPWSPPAFMKTNGSRLRGGKLKPEYRELWAEYLCRYIQEYRDRGFMVERISLQNEPKAVQTWDSCIYTAQEEKEFLRDYMYPAMERHGLTDVEVFLWDHNKERVYEWMRDIIDEETDPMVAGAAFHWYSGDHFEALDLCREAFPHKKLILSESCIEFSKFDPKESVTAAQRLAHEIIGDLNHGLSAFYDWNLLLDEKGGPNHVGNYCLAPFMYDTKEHRLMPQLLCQYIGHFSHDLVPGSVRIGHSRFSDEIDVTTWKRPDGSLLTVLLNRTDAPRTVVLRLGEEEASLVLYPLSISTCIVTD